jgi:hypothetical protein
MLLNKLFNVIGAIFCGNWDLTGNGVLFRYLFRNFFTAQAGKRFAGYGNPGQDVTYPPDLSVLFDSEESTQLLSNMAIYLFSIDLLHGKELKPFQNVMLALMLMFHHTLTASYNGCNHLIVETLNASAKYLAIPASTMYK